MCHTKSFYAQEYYQVEHLPGMKFESSNDITESIKRSVIIYGMGSFHHNWQEYGVGTSYLMPADLGKLNFGLDFSISGKNKIDSAHFYNVIIPRITTLKFSAFLDYPIILSDQWTGFIRVHTGISSKAISDGAYQTLSTGTDSLGEEYEYYSDSLIANIYSIYFSGAVGINKRINDNISIDIISGYNYHPQKFKSPFKEDYNHWFVQLGLRLTFLNE